MKNKEEIFNEIITSKKYSNLSKDLINKLIDEELPKYKSNKDIIKSVKNRLHQLHGIYKNDKSDQVSSKLLEEEMYDKILMLHTSTKERLNDYSKFYKDIFEVTGKPKTILDLACGYNPFSLSYLNIKDIEYYAYDINEETNELLNKYFKKENIKGYAKVLDLSSNIPNEKVDLTLILKFLPLLKKEEQLNLLDNLNTKYIVISFPTKSVSGKNVGMKQNYTNNFKELIINKYNILKEIEYDNEIVFIIERDRNINEYTKE